MAEKNAGLMSSVFSGSLNNGLLFPYPSFDSETSEVVEMVIDSYKEFASREIKSQELDESHDIPRKILDGLFNMGIMALVIPEEYGGGGLNMTAYCKIMEGVGAFDGSIAATIGAHQSIGMKALLLHGNEEQKKRYLQDLASGKRLAAYALTEPEAGSDAASIKTKAEPVENGEAFLLTGSKLWITNGGIANFFTLFARDNVDGKDSLTAFIVDGETPGLTRGKPENKMGLRASNTAALFLDKVRVPSANILGERGKGFRIAMEVIDYGRLSLSAGCLGGAREIMNLSIQHAKQRWQFGAPISDLEMIKAKITDMSLSVYGMESVIYLTTSLVDRGVKDFSIESAICKTYASEKLWKTINHALQIVGGIGYMCEYPYERFMRDARVNMIFEGTNEIQRLYIALAGMKGIGKDLSDLFRGGKLSGTIKYCARFLSKTFSPYKLDGVSSEFSREAEIIERDIKDFSRVVEKIVLKNKKDIVKKGYIQERVANSSIAVYSMLCVLSKAESNIRERGRENSHNDILMCREFILRSHRDFRRNLYLLEYSNDKSATDIANSFIESSK